MPRKDWGRVDAFTNMLHRKGMDLFTLLDRHEFRHIDAVYNLKVDPPAH
ncbi:hypothetical protein YA0871_14940 [Pseudomonas paralactis]|uniref:Uncharacterized protein n=1 Tax=Pseudomonas paralactis TaxID=1615673 RepID=A0ABS0V100_9PSED|nr:hypothetical protein [Pseudomonas paralactis]MBI6633960.1 hypothetical protein [Pseudomonas paralactis]